MTKGYLTPIRIAICIRVAAALLSITYFQPDEYFQALEPAHRLVFGYGHLTWEWRTLPPIRSIFFPMLFAPIYWLLKVLNLDGTDLLIWTPKLLQGLFASVTDIAVRRLSRNVLGERYVPTAFFLSLTSLFHLQALSRTLSNSLETSLTALALSYWPFATIHSSQSFTKPLTIAAIACMVRPTNAIIWVFLILELSWRLRRDPSHLMRLCIQASIVGTIACSLLLISDTWYFSTYTFTPLNFLKTNLSPISTFYGRSPWHYYFTQAIPVLCNITTPLVLFGTWQGFKTGTPPLRRLIVLIVWTILVYSLAAHKEWRFIHPLLPMMHVVAAKFLVDSSEENATGGFPFSRKWGLAMLILLGITPYLLFVQSRAQIAVMHHLRSIPAGDLRSVGFLMPCHSTPWQSYLHRSDLTERSLWALGCEPPIGWHGLDMYQDQSDIFFTSPIRYLQTRFPVNVDPDFPPSEYPASTPGAHDTAHGPWKHSWPSHLVFFGSLLDCEGVHPLLMSLGYLPEWYGWNGWEQDDRRRGGVVVWSWQSQNVVSRDL